MGGWLYEFGHNNGLAALCWWFFGLMGLGVAIGVAIFQGYERRLKPDSNTPAALALETVSVDASSDKQLKF